MLSTPGGVFEEQPDSDGLLQDSSPGFITEGRQAANISHTDPPPPPPPALCCVDRRNAVVSDYLHQPPPAHSTASSLFQPLFFTV